jgi:hypothetical protein
MQKNRRRNSRIAISRFQFGHYYCELSTTRLGAWGLLHLCLWWRETNIFYFRQSLPLSERVEEVEMQPGVQGMTGDVLFVYNPSSA